MPISISMVVVGTHLVVAAADQVPAFDIARSCKLDTAATTGPSVDQSLKNCVDDENRARQELVSQWPKFSASSKPQCIPLEGIGGDPSYVSLLTCLQMYLWDRMTALGTKPQSNPFDVDGLRSASFLGVSCCLWPRSHSERGSLSGIRNGCSRSRRRPRWKTGKRADPRTDHEVGK